MSCSLYSQHMTRVIAPSNFDAVYDWYKCFLYYDNFINLLNNEETNIINNSTRTCILQ